MIGGWLDSVRDIVSNLGLRVRGAQTGWHHDDPRRVRDHRRRRTARRRERRALMRVRRARGQNARTGA